MKMTDNFWKNYGLVLEWLGVIYFVGFGLFGLFFGIILPRISDSLRFSGQQSFLAFFMVIAAAAWYEGKELRSTTDLNLFDKVVAVAVLVVLVVFATPQLVEAYASLIPIIRG